MTTLRALLPLAFTCSFGCAYDAGVPGLPGPADPDPEFDGDGGGEPATGLDSLPAPPDLPPPAPPTGGYEWSRGYGGPAADVGYGVAVDRGGGIALAGSFFQSVDVGGGPLDGPSRFAALAAGYAADGAHAWSRGFAGPGNHHAYAVAVDAEGHRVVAGAFTGAIDFGTGELTSLGSRDIFVAKLDGEGHTVWAQRLGGAGADFALAVAVNPQGEVAVVGALAGDVYMAKLSRAGEPMWARSFGSAGDDAATGIAIDARGTVAVCGEMAGALSAGGPLLTSAGERDGFVAVYAASGEPMWSHRLGGPSDDGAAAVAFDPSGAVVVAGRFRDSLSLGGEVVLAAGGSDAFVARFTATGAVNWGLPLGGAGDDLAEALAIGSDGDLVVVGSFMDDMSAGGPTLTSAGGQDAFVIKLGSDGQHRWSRGHGSPANDFAAAVAVRADGGVLVTGGYQGMIDFGGGPHEHAGDFDLFLLSLSR